MNIIAFEVEDWERQAFESLQEEHWVMRHLKSIITVSSI